jgi:hypothetical protein
MLLTPLSRFAFFLALLSAVSGCVMPFSRKVSREGFTIVIPSSWIDYTSGEAECLNVGSKWEKGYLLVGRLPGKSAFALDLLKKGASLEPKTVTVEALSQWYQFTGSGYRFRRHDRNGQVFQENVIFFPDGVFSGYYIDTAVISTRSGSQKEYDRVIKSLRREK